jgi:hypothetical protein
MTWGRPSRTCHCRLWPSKGVGRFWPMSRATNAGLRILKARGVNLVGCWDSIVSRPVSTSRAAVFLASLHRHIDMPTQSTQMADLAQEAASQSLRAKTAHSFA